jgi:WS/DGAT/MGAT family acyltransferase
MLDPLESLMLTAELVSSPMHVAALLILRPPPGEEPRAYVKQIFEDTLTAAVDIDIDRRLRRVPHSGLDTGFLWTWRDLGDTGAELDIRHHFQRRTLPNNAGPGGLWEMVSDLHALRLDRSEPLWMAYLIDGLPDGRFALYIKVHHTVVDGVAGLQMITESLSADPDDRGMPPFFAAKAPTPRPEVPGAGARPGLLSALRGIADAASAGVELTGKVVRTHLASVLGSLVTDSIVAPFSAPQTRFNSKLGPFRAVSGTSMDRGRIRAVEEAGGVTGNDVIMAVISASLRNWLAERGELPGRSLVAICPVTVRKPGTAAAEGHGNQFGMGLCPLGTDVADDAHRLELVHTAMAHVKKQVAEQGSGAMLVAMGPAIGPTILLPMLPFDTGVPPSFNLPISNVPGPPQQMYLNGARVEEIYPVSSIWDGMALNVTVCSYADRISIGYVADRDVMPDIATLIPLTDRALTDLERALGLAAQ